MRASWLALTAALACAACNPTSLKQGYCRSDADCPSKMCHTDTWTCEPLDGSADKSDGDARDGGDAEAPFNCNNAKDMCPADAGSNVCNPDGGMCVECLTSDHCLAKNVNAPICEAQMCRACKTDDDCGADPKICLPDGHCAKDTEVIYVEYNASVCPNVSATGKSANPYCTPNEAVSNLASTQNVIVIRGAANTQMSLATTGLKPVVIGRTSSSGNGASVPAIAATGIAVSSDDVLIRDLLVNVGTTPTSKGIAATGASTTLTLSNVTVNLGTDGLGIQADNGATLKMDHCIVTNNLQGGIRLDSVQFDIKNTKVTNNGPGDDMGASWGGFRVTNVVTNGTKFLGDVTVQNNNAVGISCSAAVISDGVFVSGNVGVQISPSCNITPCTPDAGVTCGAQF